MHYSIDNKIYDVEITRKKGQKYTYVRVKDSNTISVTTNRLTPNFEIERILKKSDSSIRKMIKSKEKELTFSKNFYYLGKKYDVVNTNDGNIILGSDKVFIDSRIDIDKWYRYKASTLFKDRLDYWYNQFSRSIPYPSLTIRKMKTRWGVCNIRDKKVTLNLELMKHDIDCLDYVIVHELSHLVYGDHSKNFWNVVEENYPDYKDIRKRMKKYEL